MSAAQRITRWLAPHFFEFFHDDLKAHVVSSSITREMVEALANDLGREVTFDLQTGCVTIHPLKAD